MRVGAACIFLWNSNAGGAPRPFGRGAHCQNSAVRRPRGVPPLVPAGRSSTRSRAPSMRSRACACASASTTRRRTRTCSCPRGPSTCTSTATRTSSCASTPPSAPGARAAAKAPFPPPRRRPFQTLHAEGYRPSSPGFERTQRETMGDAFVDYEHTQCAWDRLESLVIRGHDVCSPATCGPCRGGRTRLLVDSNSMELMARERDQRRVPPRTKHGSRPVPALHS